ncbi:c-type cytochrome [Hyphomicrobium sulfonivorans]|nr:cytochrome c [Hyphomicrobium sulfonivorans]MBI1650849.1 cytochrome c [Hyphomicrobium sulfonivorans]
MSMFRAVAAAVAMLVAVPLIASASGDPAIDTIGTAVSPEELAKFFVIMPDGEGLPPGSGTAAAGLPLYAEKCAMCHGENLEGLEGTGAPPLAGGRGTLATKKPFKSVESYWPYASTLYDYIWRAMPFHEPGSLTPDEVYSITAYILSFAKIIDEATVLDAKSLSEVKMPNVDGFYVDNGPDRLIYRAQGGATSK